MNLLENVISNKREEVEKQKITMPLEVLKRRKLPGIRDFRKSFEKGKISLIAEIKKMSPSGGSMRLDLELVKLAQIFERSGAKAISVLTDGRFFGGCIEDLIKVKKAISLPVLRKEFIIDEYQIFESRFLGADAILLIARILGDSQLERFLRIVEELGITCLVEVHSENELERVLRNEAPIIGINNRDLDTLGVDIGNSLRLKQMIPNGYITISESGIKRREDVLKLQGAGFDGMLVGEALLKEKNIEAKVRELYGRSL